MKYYIIAGERSGDLHASNLIRALKLKDPQAEVRGMGGELMRSEGASLFCDYNAVSFMGFFEVFMNLFKIMKVMDSVKADLLHFQPDVLILVDFGGFNMKMAKFAKQKNIRVFYYISPKIWAWNQGRAWKIKKSVDKMFVILPFEKEFYKKYQFDVDYIGNPVNDAVRKFLSEKETQEAFKKSGKPVIALLPGSRRQEVENMLAILDKISSHFPEYEFIIAGVSNLPKALYEAANKTRILYDQTYELLSVAEAAVVTSGTATLETALLSVPQVVVYRTSGISYSIAKFLIKVKYISLVNLIAGSEVVKELIQAEFTSGNVIEELRKILPGNAGREKQLKSYAQIQQLLGEASASEKAAGLMVDYLKHPASF